MSATRIDPSSSDLHKVLSQVLESFAYALPFPRAEAGELGLAVRGALPGGRGWLVLRSTPALATRLADDAMGADADELARDAFAELCNLCVSHLVSLLWGDEHAAFKAFVPVEGLPDGVECSRTLVDVEGEPLEASFWSPQ